MSRIFTEKDAIFMLQTYLRAQRSINENAPLIAVDGIFDTETRNALIDFQLRNGLSPTGKADRVTWDLLYSQYLDTLASSALPDPIIPFPSYPSSYILRRGDKSFLVATLQFILNEIGIIYNTFEAIEINGEYDVATEEIIKDFQTRNGLSPTGEVDRTTWSYLARIYNLSMHYIEQN